MDSTTANNLFNASSDRNNVTKCVPDPVFHNKVTTHYYNVNYSDNYVMQFVCIQNYHHAGGDLIMTCSPDGTWLGTEPICEVDYYMQKYRLSLGIIAATLFLPLLLLGLDFVAFVKKRRARRTVFVKTVRSYHTTPRITGYQSKLQLREIRKAFIGASVLDDDVRSAFSTQSKDIWRKISYFPEHPPFPYPPINPNTGRGVWYESPSERQLNQAYQGLSMFGAAGHLAKIGKRFWN